MAVPVVEQCSTCKWWQKKSEKDTVAECHRYAPMPDGTENRMTNWKLTTANTTCGDWMKAPK